MKVQMYKTIASNYHYFWANFFMVFNFLEGEIFLVDKPLEWTSFDVVNKIRNEVRKIKNKEGEKIYKNLKVGHAGTLDPLATGLLIIGTGKNTKRLDEWQAQEKEYTGEFFLGATTPSFDKETEINKHFEVNHITTDLIFKAAKTLTGDLMQTPPVHSAIKQEGERVYEKARRGEEVIMKQKPVTVFEFEIIKTELPLVSFRIVCSKGTYIRSLADDFGKALNSGAYLHKLCRTRSGSFMLSEAHKLEALVAQIQALH